MGRALEVVAGLVTGTAGTPFITLTPSTGLSFTVRGTDATKNVWLLDMWSMNTTATEFRLISPRLHDNVQGLRYRRPAASVIPAFPNASATMPLQRLYAQDQLNAQISATNAELDVGALLLAYEDLAGVAGRFIDAKTMRANGLNMVTLEVTVTGVATGNFGGAVAINSTFDTLIANTDYAVVGGVVDTRCNVVRMLGVDLGNLGVGFPGEPSIQDVTSNWFIQLSDNCGLPCIPVINSANKSATTIDVQTTAGAGTFIINLTLVQLKPGVVPAAAGGGAAAA